MVTKRHIPERTCCGCFSKRAVTELWAVTRLKDGTIAVNSDHKYAGRSAYLCRNKFCLAKSRDRKGRDGLSHTLKVRVPATIWAELENEIIKK